MTQEQLNISLFKAVRDGNIGGVKQAIKDGADVNAKDEYACTPLHHAAWHGNTAIANLLIDNDAIVNARSDFMWTPWYLALSELHKETAALLKQHGGVI